MPVRQWKDGQGRKRFAVEFEQRGHRVFRRLPPGATKEQAAQLETRLKHELIDQTIIGKRPNVSLESAIRSWLVESVANRKSAAHTRSHADRVLAATDPAQRLDDVAAVAETLRSAPDLAPATINRRLCILKAVSKFAWRKGWSEENLSARIQLLPEKTYTRREVTPAMARALIAAAPTPRAKALIALSAYTGLRLGEVLKLKPADVRGGVIVTRDTKNGTDRLIPILPGLKPHLAQLPFTAGWRNVYRGFEQARRASGIQIRYHDLRHMVGSALTNSGEGLRGIADILGHKSLQTTARYTHPSLEAKRKALRKALAPISTPIKRRQKTKKAA
jgi:integrase